MSYLAIDIGGTKLAAGIVTDDGELVSRVHIPTPSHDSPESLWNTLFQLVKTLDGAPNNAHAIGVGCGGPMDRNGEHVSPLNIPAWRGFPLRSKINQAFGLPTFVDNDAKALALGEGWKGAARDAKNYIAMVVSTGVGGGIVLDGRLLDGNSGNAGHIGHIVVEPNGRQCVCGARGCLEAEASGTAIAAITGAAPKNAPEAVKERTGTLVGRAIAITANLLDLQLAVVAGSVALGYGAPFFDAAQHTIDSDCKIEFARKTTVKPAGLGDAGPLIGAAAVARAALR